MTSMLSSPLYRLILGLAIIGAVSALATIGDITGPAALGAIGTVGGLLLGGELALATPPNGSTTPPSNGPPG